MEKHTVTVTKVIFRNSLQKYTIFLGHNGKTYLGHLPIVNEDLTFEVDVKPEVAEDRKSKKKKTQYLLLNHTKPEVHTAEELRAFFYSDFFEDIEARNLEFILSYLGLSYLKDFKNQKKCFAIIRKKVPLDKDEQDSLRNDLRLLEKKLERLDDQYVIYSHMKQMGFDELTSIKVAFSEYITSPKSLTENPYQILIPFNLEWSEVDKVALNIGIDFKSTVRKNAAILFVLFKASEEESHICLPIEQTKERIPRYLQYVIDQQEYVELRKELEQNRKIVHDTIGNIYLKHLFDAEDLLSLHLCKLTQNPLEVDTTLLTEMEAIIEQSELTYAAKQKEAMLEAFQNRFLMIIGEAGTGKTSVLKKLIELMEYELKRNYEETQADSGVTVKVTGEDDKEISSLIKEYINQNILLCAPTGKAKERMKESTGKNAHTIHSVLRMSDIYNDCVYNNENPLPQKFVIVDEFSMVDTVVASKLLQAVSKDSILVIVGDDEQLPSVGPGRVLNELILSEKFKHVRLDQVYRQGEDSKILELCHKITGGDTEIVPILNVQHEDLLFIQSKNVHEIQQLILEVFESLLLKNIDIYNDFQVIVPMRKTEIGTFELNEKMQQIHLKHSKNKQGIEFNKLKIYKGDKLMQTTNNKKKGVYNGEIGKVLEVLPREKTIIVEFKGKPIPYKNEEIYSQLELCYATTIHKMQGSESKFIIMPIHYCFNRMLKRNLLYTGASRAKKKLLLFGDISTFQKSILRNDDMYRHSYIMNRIEENELRMLVNPI